MGAVVSLPLLIAGIGAFAYLGQESLPDCSLDPSTHKYVMLNSDGKMCMKDYTGSVAQYDTPKDCGTARLDADSICTVWGLHSGLDGYKCELQPSGKYRLVNKDGKYCASDFVGGAKEMTSSECNTAILDPENTCKEFGWGPDNGYGPLHCVDVGNGSYNMVNQKDGTTCLSDMLGTVYNMNAQQCSDSLKNPPCLAWGTPGQPPSYEGRYASGSSNSWKIMNTGGKSCFKDYVGTPWVVDNTAAQNAVLTGICPLGFGPPTVNPQGYYCDPLPSGNFLPRRTSDNLICVDSNNNLTQMSGSTCNDVMLRQALSCPGGWSPWR